MEKEKIVFKVRKNNYNYFFLLQNNNDNYLKKNHYEFKKNRVS